MLSLLIFTTRDYLVGPVLLDWGSCPLQRRGFRHWWGRKSWIPNYLAVAGCSKTRSSSPAGSLAPHSWPDLCFSSMPFVLSTDRRRRFLLYSRWPLLAGHWTPPLANKHRALGWSAPWVPYSSSGILYETCPASLGLSAWRRHSSGCLVTSPEKWARSDRMACISSSCCLCTWGRLYNLQSPK